MKRKLFASVAAVSLLFTSLLGVHAVQAEASEKAAPSPTSPGKPVKGYPVVGQKTALTTACPVTDACFKYASGRTDIAGITAAKSTIRIARPLLDTDDSHTLAEISVEGGPGAHNIIEVGWTVDRGLNGDSEPHLFTFAWYDNAGVQTGCNYNQGCGYIDKSTNPVNAGSSLAADVGTLQTFEIFHYAPTGFWIINYKGTEIGRYPDGLTHSSNYTVANRVQNFGEIAALHDPTNTWMGNGTAPTTGATYPDHGAEFNDQNIATGGSYSPTTYTSTKVTDANSWNAVISGTSLRYGGRGNFTAC